MAAFTWKTPGNSGNWNDPAQWDVTDGSGFPNNTGDTVEFGGGLSGYTATILAGQSYLADSVTVDTSGSQGGLTLELLSGSALTLTHDFTNNGDLGSGDFVSETTATFIVGGAGYFSGPGGNGALPGHLDWELNANSTATFVGGVTGTGISFAFMDGSSDVVRIGRNVSGFSGTVIGFQGQNAIDLTSKTFNPSDVYTFGQEGGALDIFKNGNLDFVFAGFTFGGSNTISDAKITADSGTGIQLTVCFTAGTQIAAENGAIVVENLQPGHRVVTLQDGAPVLQEVRWIGRRQLDLRAHPQVKAVAPVRISANAFADGVPHRDLIVSPDHAVLADGGLIPARMLINGMTIRQETGLASVEYFHVELDSHSILLAEGLATESYLETGHRGFFSNAAEPTILHPDMTAAEQARAEAQPCAPFLLDEASVRPVWQRLHDRAVAAGLVSETAETTRDAGLHVLAGDREFQPMEVAAGRFVFSLPAGLQSARLVSRSAAPADSQPWLNDRRQLGVAVERIELRSADGMEEVAIDHPALSQGWWKAERAGNTQQRWTNGDAKIPLPNGPVLLELTIAGTGFYNVTAADGARQAA